MQFLNEAFIPFDPHNEVVYEFKNCIMKGIYSFVTKYTTYLDNKSLSSFSSWCGRKNLDFLKSEDIRKRKRGDHGVENKRNRQLYVMKQEFLGMFGNHLYKSGFIYLLLIDACVKLIVDYPSKQKEMIKSLEEEGLEIVEYIRKSK